MSELTMDVLDAVFLGVVQGLTEWLPVSSSGHLVLAYHWLGLDVPIAYSVMLHFATALVILIMFRKDASKIIRGVLNPAPAGSRPGSGRSSYWQRVTKDPNALFGWWIIIGTIPIVVIGFVFYDIVEEFFNSILIVAISLAITGCILALTANYIRSASKKELSVLDAYTIGLAQGFALIPGLSRSGLTIAAGLMRNVDRELAARYSILLAVPAIVGAAIIETGIMVQKGAFEADLLALAVGSITAFIVGYIAIKLLLALVRMAGFHYFAIYCFVLSAIIISTV
jgi:undecaprenyl-diphosphatase